jgi:SAM-dependent methyltransferase
LTLNTIINRTQNPSPWSEGETIPWNEPEFSRRMLLEHLSQDHDMASRRTEKIKTHIEWIHGSVLSEKPSQILDLCCGPGFYSVGLAQHGHNCRGVDFSPASIEYATKLAERTGVQPVFELSDIRETDFGSNLDLVMLIFGEFNVFRKSHAAEILKRAAAALRPGGTILLEPSPLSAFEQEGVGQKWWSEAHGLFSDQPHVGLSERFWDPNTRTATDRYFIIHDGTGKIDKIASSYQAYTDEEYRAILESAGFGSISFYPSLSGIEDPEQTGVFAVTGVT